MIRTRIGSETRDLPVALAEPMRAAKGQELALVVQERRAQIENEAAVRATLKAQRDEIDQRIAGLVDVVASGNEIMPVECEVWAERDGAGDIAKVIRKDTGEVVQMRPLTEDERQMPFDFIGEPPKEKDPPPQVGPDSEQ